MLAAVRHQSEGVRFLQRFSESALQGPLLLLGPSGVGRKFSAMLAVRQAFCIGSKEPDCGCSSCYQLQKGLHPDLTVLDASGSEHVKIELVREFLSTVSDYPSSAPFRVFLVDGVDHIKAQQGDVFLKTLEETPALSRFILLAEDKARVLPTILSRCGIVRYQGLPDEFVASVVQRYEEDPTKALVYSRMSEGSVGRAIGYVFAGKMSLRDQALKLLQVGVEKDFYTLFAQVDTMDVDLPEGIRFLNQILHDVLIVGLDPMRVINVDAVPALTNLNKKRHPNIWISLSRKLKELQEQSQTVTINLKFQVKTALSETFV